MKYRTLPNSGLEVSAIGIGCAGFTGNYGPSEERENLETIQRAFELGAAGVLVAGCEFPTCHYITGNYACEKRMKRAQKQLAKKGYDPDKLWNIWCSAADGPKFAKAMHDMVSELGLAEEGAHV